MTNASAFDATFLFGIAIRGHEISKELYEPLRQAIENNQRIYIVKPTEWYGGGTVFSNSCNIVKRAPMIGECDAICLNFIDTKFSFCIYIVPDHPDFPNSVVCIYDNFINVAKSFKSANREDLGRYTRGEETLEPNTFYIFGEVTYLHPKLTTEAAGFTDIYFSFVTGDEIPSFDVWGSQMIREEVILKPHKTYLVHIIANQFMYIDEFGYWI